MRLSEALKIAEWVKSELAPHCERIEIAGSIRRKKPDVKDIEVVAIPKPYDVGLFASGIATVLNQWEMVKGQLPCKYTQRILPYGIKLDLFFATKENWGAIYAIRTGSADYSHKVLGGGWVKYGYKMEGGVLHRSGFPISTPEEEDFFKCCGVEWVKPEDRNL